MDTKTSPVLSPLEEPAVVPWPEVFEHTLHPHAPFFKGVLYYVEDPILYSLHSSFNKLGCKILFRLRLGLERRLFLSTFSTKIL